MFGPYNKLNKESEDKVEGILPEFRAKQLRVKTHKN